MHDAERLAAELISDVARRIGELRAAAGFSQADVAERIGTTVSNYQRIEHGLENVTLRTLARIAAAMNVPAVQLFAVPQSPRPGRGRPAVLRADRQPGGELFAVAEGLRQAPGSSGEAATPYEKRRAQKKAAPREG